MALTLDLMPDEQKIMDAPPPKTIVVRYGYLKLVGEFPSELANKVGCGSKLVLRTDRGTEIGEMLTTTCSNGGCGKSVTREKMLEYIDNSGGKDYPFSEDGRVLRVATAQDLAEQSKLDEQRKPHIKLARELVVKHQLPMKIVDIEYLLGQERVLIYFVSEQRIDFRNLVRDLAHDLHIRIELRQVGARDEARITADYEKCGQHCCCKQFLKVLTPISMRSAKIQKATLDPAKISGRCGRLMCCLRYEDQTYEELRKKLPKRNSRVRTPQGEAWVIDGQILTQLVLVQQDDGKRVAVPMEQIEAFDLPKPKLPNGQTMQSPNDRMPEGALPLAAPGAPRGPAPRNGPLASLPVMRPKPGQPVPATSQELTGELKGDLTDDLDDLMADAMDTAPARKPLAGPANKPPIAPPAAPIPPSFHSRVRPSNLSKTAPHPPPTFNPLKPPAPRGPMPSLPPRPGPRGAPPLRHRIPTPPAPTASAPGEAPLTPAPVMDVTPPQPLAPETTPETPPTP